MLILGASLMPFSLNDLQPWGWLKKTFLEKQEAEQKWVAIWEECYFKFLVHVMNNSQIILFSARSSHTCFWDHVADLDMKFNFLSWLFLLEIFCYKISSWSSLLNESTVDFVAISIFLPGGIIAQIYLRIVMFL